jgi:hypothetical protein
MDLQKTESGIVLTPRERGALELYENSPDGSVSLAPKTSAEFLQLYLQGYTSEEIQKLNPGFKLGLIVKARIEHDWDRHKREYIDTLLTQTRESVQKTQLEAIRFASDGMAVHQRVLGGAFKRFLQTGDEEDLGVHKDQISIRNYKEYVALLMQLTGQDSKKQVSGEITHKVEDPRTIDAAAVEGAALLMEMDKK